MAIIHGRGGAFNRIEWPTVGLILGCYATWFAAGYWLWPILPAVALAVMAVMVALQSSLMHEVLHGHPTRNSRINESLIALPIGIVWPYRRFKSLHLKHHRDERLTDPFDDPESYYQAKWKYRQMPKFLRVIFYLNNFMIARLLLAPILGTTGLILTDFSPIIAGDRKILRAWLLHGIGVAAVTMIVMIAFSMPIWLYILVPVWAGHAMIAIRTYAEHQWSERPEGRTIIVERSILGMLFLNNNLHLVHHQHPGVPWYQLPSKYWNKRDEWSRKNEGYVYPNYMTLFKKFAFRAKEPVVHPAMRRDIEQQFIFLPQGHGHDVTEGANIISVAKPQRD